MEGGRGVGACIVILKIAIHLKIYLFVAKKETLNITD